MKGKNDMTNKQIKKNLIQEMRKDIELKNYVKDIEDLTPRQFKLLINICKNVQFKK